MGSLFWSGTGATRRCTPRSISHHPAQDAIQRELSNTHLHARTGTCATERVSTATATITPSDAGEPGQPGRVQQVAEADGEHQRGGDGGGAEGGAEDRRPDRDRCPAPAGLQRHLGPRWPPPASARPRQHGRNARERALPGPGPSPRAVPAVCAAVHAGTAQASMVKKAARAAPETVLAGRPPRTDREIVLGTSTIRRISRTVGQMITVTVRRSTASWAALSSRTEGPRERGHPGRNIRPAGRREPGRVAAEQA
jgi:hypothetical protein